MNKLLIHQYYNNLDRAIQFGKSTNETSIRNYFWNLLNEYARSNNYEVSPEVACMGTKGKKVYPDGILKTAFGGNNGLWESKDEKTNLDDEIEAKIRKGYPLDNILFEDSATAVLFQRGEEVMRVSMRDPEKLHQIITEFISFKTENNQRFEDALEKFKIDIPVIVETLRKKIDDAGKKNKTFISESERFLTLCKAEINPEITSADIREMMIQHILTSDIFNKIFDDPEFHRHNNIASQLEKLIGTLYSYSDRKNLLGSIEHYYDAINSAAADIADHHEKQRFLKILYENFYKAYNPKAADRLGVVYTPNEIVNFMIESTDHLLFKHFGKTLSDKNVDILDPATGTATFISSIIDRIPKQNLAHKYKGELHANEVAILPYYIANLNIEFTFKQKMGYYEEFKNLCFVDTLDNTDALFHAGKQQSLFGLSSENAERIKNQNSKKISVIIGNPPYNANQANENENNKNREYPYIDKRIKDTYIKQSTAQKTKLYDMYSRFFRWATDRLEKNGILSFITNRSFIDSRTFDGFRKVVASEFNTIYIVDLGGDVRANPKLSGTKNNVFGIQTGVAIMFLVRHEGDYHEAKTKKELEELKEELHIASEPVVTYKKKEFFSTQGCRIYYMRRPEMEMKTDKLNFLKSTKIENIDFDRISPDKNNNWINIADNNFDSLLPVCSKTRTKKVVFDIFANGTKTNRDEWMYDFAKSNQINKIKFFTKAFNKQIDSGKTENNQLDYSIKWSRDLKNKLKRNCRIELDENKIINSLWRPFTKKYFYSEKILNDVLTEKHVQIFGEKLTLNNLVINSSGFSSAKPFQIVATNAISDYEVIEKSIQYPLYRYDKSGNRTDNITDWGLEQFVTHYTDKKIKKEDIFHYTYAVLHNPVYRKKYELNLKREFPRLPFYKDFHQWAKWGKKLMDLHINYESAKPFPLKTISSESKTEQKKVVQKLIYEANEPEAMYTREPKIKALLKADKIAGVIEIDELTALTGIPKEAWDYKLGNRSALEWVLDQYKEKKPKDPTIAEKFNAYHFADYKEHVVDLLKKVCTVSVETMKIIHEIENQK